MKVRISAGAALAVFLANAAAAQQGPAKKPSSPITEIQGFHVVLVVGDTQPAPGPGGAELPRGAQKALGDMREFLPYKHYRVLDAQWTSCCSGFSTKVSGRLQGLASVPAQGGSINVVQRPYAFAIYASNSGSGIQTRFVLDTTDDRGGSLTRDEQIEAIERETRRKNLEAEVNSLGNRLRDAQSRHEIGLVSSEQVRQLRDEYERMRRELTAAEKISGATKEAGEGSILDTSFTIQPNETVVVGTSRLGGDKALIALVTAVRKSK